ncbi:MAG TPA: proton-conducting transporter membrane subunit [Bacteroidales bacterium]
MIGFYLGGAFLISVLLFLNRNKLMNNLLVIAFLTLQWGFTIYEYLHINIKELDYFKPDALGILLLITLSIISIPAFFHNYSYIYKDKDNPKVRGIYYSAMTILVTALGAAYLSCHIAVTWIFVELTTLSASALIFHRRNSGSLEATWKYIFVCSISITFVFIGILFLSIALEQAGSTDLSFESLLAKASSLNIFWLRLAFIFIFTGFTAKLGLVPMYTAGIDAKDKAPTPAGALFSSVLMNVGFVGIFRFYEVIAHSSIHDWANHIILIAAFLSVFIATVYMLKVKNIKRMLAYSSIEHTGLVMLGLVAGGVGYYAAVLHIVLHAFVKSSLFLQIGQVYNIYKSKSIYYVGNYFKYNLLGAIVLLIAFICVTGMPPSGLFISEFMIFRSLFEAHYLAVLIPVLILLTIIIWALGKNIFKLLFSPPVGFDESTIEKVNPVETWSQFALLGLVIYLGLNPPSQFVYLLQEAVKNFVH